MHKALRTDRTAGEFIGGQICLGAQVLHAEVDLGDQQRALHGRGQARHEKSVVAARIGKRHRSAGVAAQAIGHQPLVAGGAFPRAADLAAERQMRDLFIKTPCFRACRIPVCSNQGVG
jgi:hypothetical protein